MGIRLGNSELVEKWERLFLGLRCGPPRGRLGYGYSYAIVTRDLSSESVIAMRYVTMMVLMLSVIGISGCGSGGEFPVAPTSGQVLCDGKPVPHVQVFFEPLKQGESALAGKQGSATADEDGRFTVSTYGVNDGAVVGRHRVRVGPPRPDDHPGFSCGCVTDPEIDVMEVEIVSGQKNEVQITLKKKTGREKLSREELEAIEEARDSARAGR